MAKLKNMIPFIFTTETTNFKNMKIMTSGIDTSVFNDNPVMLYNHDTEILPIGTWADLSNDGKVIMAYANFDEEDPFAVEIQGKVNRDVIKRCSVGLHVDSYDDIEILEDGSYLILKSTLLECSIVPLPANKEAVKLSFNLDKMDVSELTEENEIKITFKMNDTKEVVTEVTEIVEVVEPTKEEITEIHNAIQEDFKDVNIFKIELDEVKLKLNALELENTELKNKLNAFEQNEKESYIVNAIKEGKIGEDQKESFIELSKTNFTLVKDIIEKQKSTIQTVSLNTLVKKEQPIMKKYRDYSANELKDMKLNNTEMYEMLLKEYTK